MQRGGGCGLGACRRDDTRACVCVASVDECRRIIATRVFTKRLAVNQSGEGGGVWRRIVLISILFASSPVGSVSLCDFPFVFLLPLRPPPEVLTPRGEAPPPGPRRPPE